MIRIFSIVWGWFEVEWHSWHSTPSDIEENWAPAIQKNIENNFCVFSLFCYNLNGEKAFHHCFAEIIIFFFSWQILVWRCHGLEKRAREVEEACGVGGRETNEGLRKEIWKKSHAWGRLINTLWNEHAHTRWVEGTKGGRGAHVFWKHFKLMSDCYRIDCFLGIAYVFGHLLLRRDWMSRKNCHFIPQIVRGWMIAMHFRGYSMI